MKILLVGINAKYVHTNLAIRSIAAYSKNKNIHIYESTINDHLDEILEDIIEYKADVIGFSCYIWNIEHVLYIAENIKKINPKTIIVLGGPEVSYEVEDLLSNATSLDYIILGEGEKSFPELISALQGEIPLEKVDGLAYRKDGRILINPSREYVNLIDIPFPYDGEELEHKLVYYETSRGCPFKCSFCLSSLDKRVRNTDLKRVKEDFMKFADKKIEVVKLVDRSFNCNLSRAIEILNIIRDLPGNMSFHCEINPELVSDEFIKSLKGLEQRLQFEVGIQSTNVKTLDEICRTSNVEKSLEGLRKLRETGIKLHVDLIAGLPFESFDRFGHSFDDVYQIQPEEIQLGFLKLLKGTELRKNAQKYGIVYRLRPPYEILYSKDISYRELCILKGIAKILDKFYNSGRFKYSLKYLVKKHKRPFDFFLSFYDYCKSINFFRKRFSLKDLYDILYSFAKSVDIEEDLFKDIIKFDFLLTSSRCSRPDCIKITEDKQFYSKSRQYLYDEKWLEANLPQAIGLSKKQLLSKVCFGLFKYDVPKSVEKRDIGIVFFSNNGRKYYAKFEV